MGNHHAKKKPTKLANNRPNPTTSQTNPQHFPTKKPNKTLPTPIKNELIPDNFSKYKEKLIKKPKIDKDLFFEELSNSLDFINKLVLFKYTTTNVNNC